ncbi:hypothetical protein [Myxococcus xanthus]|uniref:Lipoprotein n=1 Tax=Myxococcus xanthus TaxID=34 RepID=A0A7Y4ILS4_MYXXA|nr:hypothetical protein [Myxococcus xanthus]NOJ81602.1 hypothetical protein [Myxococcus xanthus]NOJ89042.1 hypothetical protein [Myxococcus xanthus]
MHHHWLRRLVVAVLLATLVGACEPPLIVEFASAAERIPAPAFVIREPSQPGDVPRYDSISVMDVDGTSMWAIRTLPPRTGPFPAHVNYGVLPYGFEELQPPKPLARGRTYHIAVAGEGRGGFRFRVSNDGAVSEAK